MNSLNRAAFAAVAVGGLAGCGTVIQSNSLPTNPIVAGSSLSVPVEGNSCSRNGIDARHVTNLTPWDVGIEARKYGRTPHFESGFYVMNISGVKSGEGGTIGALFGAAAVFALTKDLNSASRAALTIGGGVGGSILGNSVSDAFTVDNLIKIDACKNYLNAKAQDYKDSNGRTIIFRPFNLEGYLPMPHAEPRPRAPGYYPNPSGIQLHRLLGL